MKQRMNFLIRITGLVTLFLYCTHDLNAAVISVKKDGSGGARTSVNAALAAAQAGDIIEIADSQEYVEDVTIVTPGITLRAAAGQTPTITAANLAERFAAIGVPGTDYAGLVVQAPNVMIEGIELYNPTTELNLVPISSVVLIAAPAVTLKNCRVKGPGSGVPNDHLGILAVTLSTAAASVRVSQCVITDCPYGTVTTTFNPAFPAAEMTVEDCTIIGTLVGVQTHDGKTTVTNCLIQDSTAQGVQVGGGQVILESCRIAGSADKGINIDYDPNYYGIEPDVTVTHCRFEDSNTAHIFIQDGKLSVSGCIMTFSLGRDLLIEADGNFDVVVKMDHCDLYQAALGAVLFQKPGSHTITATFTNCIVTGVEGFVNNSFFDDLDIQAFVVDHCDIFVDNPDFALINVTGTNNLFVDPQYEDTVDFKLKATSPLLKAGTNGSAMGSHGAREQGVENWGMLQP
ncbi:MAG TPA: right-handed parallel beta-helix repeat-containing protein [bacterium]|nr:right-handed parallel beta-helix repeat-containing protein [bacterium]